MCFAHSLFRCFLVLRREIFGLIIRVLAGYLFIYAADDDKDTNTRNSDGGNPFEPVQHVVGFLCHVALGTALGTLEFVGLRHAPLISMLPFEDMSGDDTMEQ